MASPSSPASSVASQPSGSAIAMLPGTSASSPLVIQVVSVPAAAPVEPHWTVYWSAFATPFVALIAAAIAASIAYRQWQTAVTAAATAKNKLKLDLFERRFSVFQGVAQLIVKMSQDAMHDDNDVKALLGKTAGAEFLFDERVHGFIVNKVFDRAAEVMRRQYQIQTATRNGDGELVRKLVQEQATARKWFDDALDAWKELSRPFLELAH